MAHVLVMSVFVVLNFFLEKMLCSDAFVAKMPGLVQTVLT